MKKQMKKFVASVVAVVVTVMLVAPATVALAKGTVALGTDKVGIYKVTSVKPPPRSSCSLALKRQSSRRS